jgi:hypothetical protein
LPGESQTAPVNGIVASDFNRDGNMDVMMIGNDYGNEVFAGRYDAFTGLVLAGDGSGNFQPVSIAGSGFFVNGDGKALAKISSGKEELYVATQNRDSVKVFATVGAPEFFFQPEALDGWAELELPDGKKQKIEFYYGSGYLSQSSRNIRIPAGTKRLTVHDFQGRRREITLPAL